MCKKRHFKYQAPSRAYGWLATPIYLLMYILATKNHILAKYNTEIGINNTKSTTSNPKRIKILNRITQLKEKEGLSLNEISEKLNNEKLFPLNGGKWYKSKLSSFYNYSKQNLPKRYMQSGRFLLIKITHPRAPFLRGRNQVHFTARESSCTIKPSPAADAGQLGRFHTYVAHMWTALSQGKTHGVEPIQHMHDAMVSTIDRARYRGWSSPPGSCE